MTEGAAEVRPERRRKKKKHVALQRVEYAAYRMIVSLVSGLRDEAMIVWGARLGSLASKVLAKRTRLALRNVMATFPEKSESECRRIVRDCWRHFGRVVLEYLRLQRMESDEVVARATVDRVDYLQQALARDRGVLLLTAHYGNWEVGAFLLARLAPRAVTVARRLDNDLLDADLLRSRARAGLEIVDRRKAARALIRALEQKASIVLLPDQAVQSWEGILAPFLGRDAWTTPAPARLALRYGAPIVFAFAAPEGGRIHCDFEPPLFTEDLPEEQRTVEGVTALINERLGERIRHHPELWLWMHDRWKNTDAKSDER